VVLVIVAGLALGNLSVTFLRSTIPLAVRGTVRALETRTESHPGVDDVHLVTIGGRRLHIDAAVASHLQIGDSVQKRAWSRTLHTSRGAVRLNPSAEVWGMAITMPLIAALALLLLPRYQSPHHRALSP
jgi:hypothetical protein